MKTIFLNKLKQVLFLLMAVLGTLISYSQPTRTATIGGGKTPDMGGFFDVGGKKDPGPNLFTIQRGSIQFDRISIFEVGGISHDSSVFTIVAETGVKLKPQSTLINVENNFGKSQKSFLVDSIVQEYMNMAERFVITESKRVRVSLIV
ncbi:hypothetical protein [Flavobacterium sedimenticola]|uniref:DUF4369 domain-containing protein n=1 Tax=Flavobacterium sedimenticola TaxID=3043286 RepID=A0ABT6XUM6_9FLAO|nr:hypothetical protein [Flavobacterium sedimenticola]MDI9258319.1 hypothetical protein [Flavobacterium sedimenticola]